jgi:DNA-binding XRE family transcriptional regulator
LALANGSRQTAWEFFKTELKRRREDAGLTQVELGARVFVSGGYIGQFEQAIRKPSWMWRSGLTEYCKPTVFSSGCAGS